MSAPHPLAVALIKRLHSRQASRVLDFASGSGRNADALRAAGFTVVAVRDEIAASKTPLSGIDEPFDAAISTHGLLHGNVEDVASHLGTIADRLRPGGLLYATFGSTSDTRFGRGRRIDDSTFAPPNGDEQGVAHAYFDRMGLCALLQEQFAIESLDERGVDDVVGRWAHRERALRGAVHWFVKARRR